MGGALGKALAPAWPGPGGALARTQRLPQGSGPGRRPLIAETFLGTLRMESCASPPCPGEPHWFSAAVSSELTFQLNEKCVRGVSVPRVTGCCDNMPPPGQLQQQMFGGRDLRQGHRWLRFQQEASSGFSRVLVGSVPRDSGDSVSALTRAPVLWDQDPTLVTSCHLTSVRARSPRAHTLGVEGQGFTLRLSRVQSRPGPAGLLPPPRRGQAHRHRADARTRTCARSAWTRVRPPAGGRELGPRLWLEACVWPAGGIRSERADPARGTLRFARIPFP